MTILAYSSELKGADN